MTSSNEKNPASSAGDAAGRRAKWVFAGFVVLAGVLLVTEHRAHVLGFLPWLILLACPLMHRFMHGKHGGGHHHRRHDHGAGPADGAGDGK